MVTGVTYRNPAFLAKAVTTLDVVSSGRAILGIGAAWNEEESLAYGYDWPSTSERFERLEDALHICRLMFTQPRSTFQGKRHHIEDAYNVPQPVQPGGPKILIGGGGEKKTLRLVAQYADMWNGFGDPDTIRHKIQVLADHCADVGRDPSEIIEDPPGHAVRRDDGGGSGTLAARSSRRGVGSTTRCSRRRSSAGSRTRSATRSRRSSTPASTG